MERLVVIWCTQANIKEGKRCKGKGMKAKKTANKIKL